MPYQNELAKINPRERYSDYAFSLYIPPDYAKDTLPEIVAQWRFHDWWIRKGLKTTGAPQLSLEILNDSINVRIQANNRLPDPNAKEHQPGHIWIPITVRKKLPLGPLPKERWVDFRFQVKWSTKEDGELRIWMDHELKYDERGPNTYKAKHTELPYFKMGIYKWVWSRKNLTPQTVLTTHRRLWSDKLMIRSGWGGSTWDEGCPEELNH